jgi:hypothetical protein
MKKWIGLTVLLAIVAGILTGCIEETNPSADKQLQRKTERSMSQANAQIGMPAIKNFQERKLAKMIFELRDQEKLITYAYIVNHMTGDLVFIGKCIGFGLPYSVQYTNPEKLVSMRGNSYKKMSMPQADPNGLFMPQGLSATWLMMIDPNTNEPRPVYVEPSIIVSPFPLHN